MVCWLLPHQQHINNARPECFLPKSTKMFGLKHPCTTTCQVFYFSWFLIFFFLSFASFPFCHFQLHVNCFVYLFIYFKFPSLVFCPFFFLLQFFCPFLCFSLGPKTQKGDNCTHQKKRRETSNMVQNFNLLYLPNIGMYNFTYKHNHNKCLLLTIRVNYIFALYTLHYILIWFISFQLCQFGL